MDTRRAPALFDPVTSVTAADVERFVELTAADGALDLATSPLVSAWGRRPS